MASKISLTVLRVLATLAVVAVATVLGWLAWQHYVYAPWTRDARVQADIINIAPEVAGTIARVDVEDDSRVDAGDPLFAIQPVRFKNALASARAALDQAKAQSAYDAREARRLQSLPRGAISGEKLDQARARARGSAAAVEQAQAELAQARQDLEWATVRSPVDGYVTHLLLDEGDYAARGREVLTLVDADSFRVTAYFEETKLPRIAVGDAAEVRLMAGDRRLKGHVASITRGIAVPNNDRGEQNLANVNPTFQWVRLAQRVPVRIAIDELPMEVTLRVGMSATVHIRSPEQDRTRDDRAGGTPHDGLAPPPGYASPEG